MSKLVLGDGGLYHRPDHPHVFPPGLRGAAHYLKAVDKVESKVRKDLAAILANHTFPRDFEGWRGIGLFPKKVMLKLIPGQSERVQRERFEKARPFLKAFRLWVNEYYMSSPFVFDLLYRTLELWDEIDREIVELQNSIRQEDEYAKQWPLTEDDQRVVESEKIRLMFLEKEREGWGWWVDYLSSDITIPLLNAWFLNRTAENESHRGLFERMDLLRIEVTWEPPATASPFRLILEGWRPEVETRDAVTSRFRTAFEHALRDYWRASEERLKTGQLNPRPKDSEKVRWGEPHWWEAVPTKYRGDHFKWLALRQVKGLRPQQIVSRPSVEAKISAVHDGIKDAAALLNMELRKIKPGPIPD